MELDVDEISEVEYCAASGQDEPLSVNILFKNGSRRTFSGSELPEVLAILNHWTPPTA